MMDGISKFSFRVLSKAKKKKVPHTTTTKRLQNSSHTTTRKNNTKRKSERVCVSVCVCRFKARTRVNNTHAHRNGAKLVVWRRRPRRE
jgi:hypothetical protein